MVYRVSKVLNNNTVISRDEDNNEIIVTGNGIGYGKHPGMMIDEKDVRNVYVSKSKAFIRRFAKMVNEIPDICFLEAEKIRDLAQKELNKEMSDNIVLALADHINFVVAQYRNDDTRAMLLNTEFQKIYSQEYKVALKAVKMIEEDFGIHVSEGEASAITFHLVNSEIGNSSNDAVLIANSVEDILKIVKESFRLEDDDELVDYSRLIIHLKFFVKRILMHETDDETDISLLLNPNEGIYGGISECLNRIADYTKKTFDHKISETERFYLLIHIARILQKKFKEDK